MINFSISESLEIMMIENWEVKISNVSRKFDANSSLKNAGGIGQKYTQTIFNNLRVLLREGIKTKSYGKGRGTVNRESQ